MSTETATSASSPADQEKNASQADGSEAGSGKGGRPRQNMRPRAPMMRPRFRSGWGNGNGQGGGLEVGQFVALVRRVERLQRMMEYYVSARHTKERIRYAMRFQAAIGRLSERIADELDAVARDVNRLRKGRPPTGPLADEVSGAVGNEDQGDTT